MSACPILLFCFNLLGLARSPPLYPGSDFPTREEAAMSRKIINVVGAAIIKDGEVLCARRGEGKSLAGYWEAKSNFTKALRCTDDELGLFSGTSKKHDRKYVFATVQTMSRPEILAQFSKDDFDYILIDEVHHAAADSYKRIIDYFTPDFMLGMTATPERTDGANICDVLPPPDRFAV